MATPSKQSTARPNTLGLRGRDLQTLLDKLDAEQGGASRTHLRWAFRRETVSVQMTQPGGSTTEVDMVARNLSAGGMSLLHAAFVYPNTKIVVRVPGISAGAVDVKGTVVRCMHVQGRVHEVGVKFDEMIEMRSFTAGDLIDGCFSMDQVDPFELEGRILIIDDSEIDRRIIRHFLSKTQLRIVEASTIAEAEGELRGEVDLVIADGTMKGDVVGTVRRAASGVPVVFASADTSIAGMQRVRSLGVDAFVPKPVEPTVLLRALGEFLIMRRTPNEEPASATSSAHADLGPLVLNELATLSARLKDTINGDDGPGAYAIALKVKGLAPVAGLDGLAAVAGEVTEALSDQPNCSGGAGALQALLRGLGQLKAA